MKSSSFQGWRCQTWPQEGSNHETHLHVQLFFSKLIFQRAKRFSASPRNINIISSEKLSTHRCCFHTTFSSGEPFYTKRMPFSVLRNTNLKSCYISTHVLIMNLTVKKYIKHVTRWAGMCRSLPCRPCLDQKVSAVLLSIFALNVHYPAAAEHRPSRRTSREKNRDQPPVPGLEEEQRVENSAISTQFCTLQRVFIFPFQPLLHFGIKIAYVVAYSELLVQQKRNARLFIR